MSSMRIESIENHIYNHISSKCDYKGFVIKTNENDIFLGIEIASLCCEHYDAKILIEANSDSNEWTFDSFAIEGVSHLIEKNIKSIKYDSDKRYRNHEDYFQTSLSIITEDEIITLIVFNEHNGYYPHNFLCKFDDQEIVDTL